MVALNQRIKPFNPSDMLYNDPWLNRLSQLLKSHMNNPNLNLKILADLMLISERQLYRKVRKRTNLTPNQFLKGIRLEKAKEYLETGEYHTVQEVGKTVGFVNIHYFSQQYEKMYGETPMEVLKRMGLR